MNPVTRDDLRWAVFTLMAPLCLIAGNSTGDALSCVLGTVACLVCCGLSVLSFNPPRPVP